MEVVALVRDTCGENPFCVRAGEAEGVVFAHFLWGGGGRGFGMWVVAKVLGRWMFKSFRDAICGTGTGRLGRNGMVSEGMGLMGVLLMRMGDRDEVLGTMAFKRDKE